MATALWFTAPRTVQLKEVSLPEPSAGQVRVRGLFSAVSHGTERLLYQNEGPQPFDDSLAETADAPTYPRRYGYAWVGEVERGGPGLARGTRVFALASHATEHVLDETRVRSVPDDVPPLRATLAATLETAVTAIWDSRLALGESALVIGGGSVGTSIAWLAVRAGATRVTLAEPSEARRRAAAALGVKESVTDARTVLARGYDVVFEATGNPSLLDSAIAAARPGGRIVVVSFYGQRSAPVSLGAHFHRGRLALVSSQVSAIPPHLSSRFDHARRFDVVRGLLAEPALDALFEAPVPFSRAAELYARLSAHAGEALQLAFSYGS